MKVASHFVIQWDLTNLYQFELLVQIFHEIRTTYKTIEWHDVTNLRIFHLHDIAEYYHTL